MILEKKRMTCSGRSFQTQADSGRICVCACLELKPIHFQMEGKRTSLFLRFSQRWAKGKSKVIDLGLMEAKEGTS